MERTKHTTNDNDLVRVNFDFPAADHTYVKLISTHLGMTLREFMTSAVHKAIEEYEMQRDLEAYDQAIEDIENGAKVVTLEEFKRSIGYEDV